MTAMSPYFVVEFAVVDIGAQLVLFVVVAQLALLIIVVAQFTFLIVVVMQLVLLVIAVVQFVYLVIVVVQFVLLFLPSCSLVFVFVGVQPAFFNRSCCSIPDVAPPEYKTIVGKCPKCINFAPKVVLDVDANENICC